MTEKIPSSVNSVRDREFFDPFELFWSKTVLLDEVGVTTGSAGGVCGSLIAYINDS